ncbi:MAG: GNAT family N-acetyltransferase [Candidatus Micrarchaeaceae archaeon]
MERVTRKNVLKKSGTEGLDLIFRRAKSEDVEALRVLFKDVVIGCDYYNSKAKEAALQSYKESVLEDKVKSPSNIILVADDQTRKRLVGFSLCRIDRGFLWIDWSGTKAKFRRKGVRSNLWYFTKRIAKKKGISTVMCYTLKNNVPATTFLKKNGFERLGVNKNMWYEQDYILWRYRLWR